MGQNVKPLSFDRFLELRESKEQERQKGFARKIKGTLKRSDDVDVCECRYKHFCFFVT